MRVAVEYVAPHKQTNNAHKRRLDECSMRRRRRIPGQALECVHARPRAFTRMHFFRLSVRRIEFTGYMMLCTCMVCKYSLVYPTRIEALRALCIIFAVDVAPHRDTETLVVSPATSSHAMMAMLICLSVRPFRLHTSAHTKHARANGTHARAHRR